jgi:hypothetical protein
MSAIQFDLLASAAQTASGNGATVDVSGIKELLVFVDATATSGTVTEWDVWIESSNDGGTSWFEVLADSVFKNGGTDPGPAGEAGTGNQLPMRDIVNETAGQASSKYVAKYSVFGNKVRLRWSLAGTTPSQTFSGKAVGKN